MKKKFLLLMLLPFIFCGCVDKKPTNWNVKEDRTWEIWAEGELLNISITRPAYCDKRPVCSYGCTAHGGIGKMLEFKEGKYRIHLTRDPGRIKVGQKGILYKYNNSNSDSKSWFQWIPYDSEDTVEQGLINYETKTN